MTSPAVRPSTTLGDIVRTGGDQGFYNETMGVLSGGLGVSRRGVRIDPSDTLGPAGVRIGDATDAIGFFGRTPRTRPNATTAPANSIVAADVTAITASGVSAVSSPDVTAVAASALAAFSDPPLAAEMSTARTLINELRDRVIEVRTLANELKTRMGEVRTLTDELKSKGGDVRALANETKSLTQNNGTALAEVRTGLGNTNSGVGLLGTS